MCLNRRLEIVNTFNNYTDMEATPLKAHTAIALIYIVCVK